mgnify:CR=1 FL=1|jgi:hypothetical protein
MSSTYNRLVENKINEQGKRIEELELAVSALAGMVDVASTGMTNLICYHEDATSGPEKTYDADVMNTKLAATYWSLLRAQEVLSGIK